MPAIRIHGGMWSQPPFDLKEILVALEPFARSAHWSVGHVPKPWGDFDSGEFDATGDGAEELEAFVASGERIDGVRLLKIAKRTHQVIWGQFRGYASKETKNPDVVLTSIDSTYWQLECIADAHLQKVAQVFPTVDWLT